MKRKEEEENCVDLILMIQYETRLAAVVVAAIESVAAVAAVAVAIVVLCHQWSVFVDVL